jgi:hypothetical protein
VQFIRDRNSHTETVSSKSNTEQNKTEQWLRATVLPPVTLRGALHSLHEHCQFELVETGCTKINIIITRRYSSLQKNDVHFSVM